MRILRALFTPLFVLCILFVSSTAMAAPAITISADDRIVGQYKVFASERETGSGDVYQMLRVTRTDPSVDTLILVGMSDLNLDKTLGNATENMTGVGPIDEMLGYFFEENEGAKFGISAATYTTSATEAANSKALFNNGRFRLKVTLPAGTAPIHIALRAFASTKDVATQNSYFLPYRFVITRVIAKSSTSPDMTYVTNGGRRVERPEIGILERVVNGMRSSEALKSGLALPTK
ncbi:MAG TPA: hypothetical protein VM103_01205 [Candidatus Paceibacterota bacterium]|nr:hypothetical protein [Candidatus Paceibacterota bacterium]